MSSNFNETERLIREKRQQLLKKLQDKVDKKTNSMIEHARRVLENSGTILQQKVAERETFMIRVQATADRARSLLENGNDEEIVRSCQSVQNVTDNAAENPKIFSVSWSSDEIDTMLLADIIKDKGTL